MSRGLLMRILTAVLHHCQPFMDEVMDALNAKYPNLIVQFEDFSTERAFYFLERYQKERRVSCAGHKGRLSF